MASYLSSDEKKGTMIVGLCLVIIGIGLLLELTFDLGWSATGVEATIAIFFFIQTVVKKKTGLGVVSSLSLGIITALFAFFMPGVDWPWTLRLGLLIILIGAGFLYIPLCRYLISRRISYWGFFSGWVIIAVGIPFLLAQLSLLDFVFWVVTGVGSGLLIWGLGRKWIGLIIPGSILSTIGAGIYFAWAKATTSAGLSETGIMLVWFALGWGAIIVFFRIINARFIWWPLIPGGIMAVVGWGLYSGGSPNAALSFIGNTGSIGVLIFGLYLILMRRGLKR